MRIPPRLLEATKGMSEKDAQWIIDHRTMPQRRTRCVIGASTFGSDICRRGEGCPIPKYGSSVQQHKGIRCKQLTGQTHRGASEMRSDSKGDTSRRTGIHSSGSARYSRNNAGR